MNVRPTRTLQTVEVYEMEGDRHLRRALRFFPHIACPVEALAVSVETDPGVLKPRTVRRYRQEVAEILDRLVADGVLGSESAEIAMLRIIVALDERQGRPDEPRTSSRKVVDATKEEWATVLADLRVKAKAAHSDAIDHLLVDLVAVAPIVGLRPIEWGKQTTRIEGTSLVVQCAKATNGRACAAERRVEIASFAPDVIDAITRIVRDMPSRIDEAGDWPRLLAILAERLARSCRRTNRRRLSLYSFRHAAMASWKAAKFEPECIAALAGHKTCKTQKAYAGGRHGWDMGDVFPVPDPLLVASIGERAATARAEVDAIPAVVVPDDAVLDAADQAETLDRNGKDFARASDAATESHTDDLAGDGCGDEYGTETDCEISHFPTPIVRPGTKAVSVAAATLFARFSYQPSNRTQSYDAYNRSAMEPDFTGTLPRDP